MEKGKSLSFHHMQANVLLWASFIVECTQDSIQGWMPLLLNEQGHTTGVPPSSGITDSGMKSGGRDKETLVRT